MKNLLFVIAFLFTSAITFAQSIYVPGYTRSNGTYVPGYTRSSINQTYSTPIYSQPTYVTPVYQQPVYRTNTPVYSGSRGGQYYINSNGNKTYVR
jgi:hypothetical protein